MPANSQVTRDRAETAFAKTQTQTLVREHIASERDEIDAARDAKTQRLKEMRLERDASEAAAAAASAAAPKAKRVR